MTIIVAIGKALLNIIYMFLKLLPVQKKILFLSRQSDEPSADIVLLQKKIEEMHPDYKTVALAKKLNGPGYIFHMLRQMAHLATSQVLILDSYCIAASILKHRESLLIIQMWHSVGTMKKFGYSILDMPEGSSSRTAKAFNMHRGYDYVLAAGEGYKDHLAEGMDFPRDRIVTLPLPRLELLQDASYVAKTRERIFAAYPALKEKKNIVYVPTFRKNDEAGFEAELRKLAQAIDNDKYNFIPKLHPLTKFEADGGGMILDRKFTSFEMLTVADIVVSDYSCIIYEAAVLRKPLYFYAYDYEAYMAGRSLYIDYFKEMPGPVCRTPEELAAAVEGGCDMDALDAFLKKYVSCTGREAENIVDFVFSHLKK